MVVDGTKDFLLVVMGLTYEHMYTTVPHRVPVHSLFTLFMENGTTTCNSAKVHPVPWARHYRYNGCRDTLD